MSDRGQMSRPNTPMVPTSAQRPTGQPPDEWGFPEPPRRPEPKPDLSAAMRILYQAALARGYVVESVTFRLAPTEGQHDG